MRNPGQVGHAELAAQARRHTLRVEAQVARVNAAAPRFPRDAAADARCRQTFGMTGGECGCGELGCDTCAFSPAGPCGCGSECDHWPRQTNTRHLGARVKWKPPVVANPVVAGPGAGLVWRAGGATDATGSGAPTITTTGAGMLSRDGGEMPSDMVDFHTHIPAPTNQDWADTAGGRPDLTTQINALDAMDPATQFQGIGVSMNPIYDETFEPNDTFIQGTETLNEATAFCADELSRILPFAQVPYYEIGSEDALDVVESMLANGFVGIGELLVHGHGLDGTDYGWGDSSPVEALVPILELAAKHDVPVLLHWDLLTTDGDNPSPEESRRQFMELLDAVKEGVVVRGDPLIERRAVKVVLAHCGAGPEGGDNLVVLDEDLDESDDRTFGGMMRRILMLYPTVYFDLSGMQVRGVTQLQTGGAPTHLGDFLLTKMQRYPTRFLYGSDVLDPATDGEHYTTELYEQFLNFIGGPESSTSWWSDIRPLFFRDNAIEVLTSKPRVAWDEGFGVGVLRPGGPEWYTDTTTDWLRSVRGYDLGFRW